ncbi:pyridoxamine 5'-phosphate oxidase family protein [Catenisphaera adipataccumulans]|jgi:nitroimidazol reductase NimA-like FMN-containing flavoprotein (pyridoxamine 5'-phosphate oxidase superfamily)|uniref:5-nitroimidazole antibiotic resistance protein n=1 Tax=Catenisphaera adipataccumulans TaxID=700500 RepID=A0A7W8CX98_9FIRM|nr:pyridoxamine 5'-phosphate oxidase family protein [Catenisphaera adipataccumulans]MBB5182104.1 hypothetical protein [Catenisphaera adipataccumulans]
MFRKMRRFKQEISHAECEELLREQGRGTLCFVGENGYPYGVPINFLYDDGKIYFHGAAQGQKADSAAKNDKVCFTVIEPGRPDPEKRGLNVRSVMVFGRYSVVHDHAVREDKLRKLGLKYFPEEPEYIDKEVQKYLPTVCITQIEIEHMTGKLVNES